MQIVLSEKLSTDDKLYVSDGEYVDLPATNIKILDTNIVLPAIFPKESRKPDTIVNYIGKSVKWKPRQLRIRNERKRIKIVNAIESGKFQECGIYPGITNHVWGELKHWEEKLQVENIKRWWKKLNEKTYSTFVSVKGLRDQYKSLSQALPENADFSVAMASCIIGSDLATDDYTSFNNCCINMFKKVYFERWGSKKRFQRYDSDSLLMLLRK